MALVKRYKISDNSCNECLEHLLEEVSSLEGIIDVKLDLDEKEIIVKSCKSLDEEKISNILINQKKYHEAHKSNLIEEEFFFEEIDCPNCAAKIEEKLNKEERIDQATINFISKKVTIVHSKNDDILPLVNQIARTIEKDAVIYRNKGLLIKSVKGSDKEEHSCQLEDKHHTHHHLDECCQNEHEEHIHGEEKRKDYKKITSLVTGIVLAISGTILKFTDNLYVLRMILFSISYLLLAYDLLLSAFNGIKNKDFFNENTLMALASLGALIIDEGFEAIMVVLLNAIGEYYQEKASENSKKAIENMMSLDSKYAQIKDGPTVLAEQLTIGQIIVIKPGEKIPVDGKLLNQEALLDMKSLTGESLPVSFKKDDTLLSGSINLDKVVELEVTKEYSESTLSKVKELIQKANDKKSKSQEFITKFAKIYTPIIILVAIVIGLVQGLILRNGLVSSLNSVFSILVIACPCALVISIPLCYFSGIGRASKDGILVKGGNYLEALVNSKSFVFDKTGTLTKGNFEITKVEAISTNKEDLLKKAAMCEVYSSHPIAVSIKKAYKEEISFPEDFEIEEISGEGIKFTSKSSLLLAGNEKLLNRFNISFTPSSDIGSIVYVVENNRYLGYIVISDEVKMESKELITYLKNNHYKTYMLSGDNEKIVDNIASYLGIDEKKAKLLPDQKYQYLEEIIKETKGSVVYVGDGINDSPSLSLSDVGISLGGIGSDVAKECADVVIMNDDISKIKNILLISKKTRKIMIENIIFILFIKLLAIIIGSSGILGQYAMLLSLFSDVGVSLLAILNTTRILKKSTK